MFEQFDELEWLCEHCGGSGRATLLAGLSMEGLISELVTAHSLACNGCDGNARRCLRVRRADCSDANWERMKEQARNRAATIHHKEPAPIVAGESPFSVSSLREYLSGEPRWDDRVRAAWYLR